MLLNNSVFAAKKGFVVFGPKLNSLSPTAKYFSKWYVC